MAGTCNQTGLVSAIGFLAVSGAWILVTRSLGTPETSSAPPGFWSETWREWGLVCLGGVVIWLTCRVASLRSGVPSPDVANDSGNDPELGAESKAVLEHAADAIISADECGVIRLFNPAASRIFGYEKKEVLGQNIKMLIPRPYLPEHESYRLPGSSQVDEVDSSSASAGREVIGRRKDGTNFPLELTVSEVVTEPHRLFIAVARDITERKQAEMALERSRRQLRSLAGRLQHVREEERTHMAREIHDELGQSLTGVKMDLAWLKSHVSSDRKSWQERAEMMGELIDATIQTVRRLATDLRPGILDNLGLVAALEWQAEEFENRTGICCRCTSHLDDAGLAADHQTALFRIFQETLTNVVRHAQATLVEVELSSEAEGVLLRIRDNGRGITDEELTGSSSLGLLGIRERAAMLGGEVDIVGKQGQGTMVTAHLPKPKSDLAAQAS